MLCTLRDLYKTEYNYHRALVWDSRYDRSFPSRSRLQQRLCHRSRERAHRDATQTPGYGDCTCEASFVFSVLKSVMNSPEEFRSGGTSSRIYFGIDVPWSVSNMTITETANFTAALENVASLPVLNSEVRSALLDAVPILVELGSELALDDMTHSFSSHYSREPLYTRFVSF